MVGMVGAKEDHDSDVGVLVRIVKVMVVITRWWQW